MIVVITGVPGSGKTLYAISWIKDKAAKEGREVYYSGIADLKLPWVEHDPTKWEELPPNSIIVIDECQRVARPRANGSQVPPYIAAMETHRHKGVDIVLITQHPMLIDQNIRRLCGLHFHVMRVWGTQSATVHEWPQIKENCDKSRSDSVKHVFKYPRDVYALYKSAEVHTHKARIPAKVLVLAAVPFVLAFLGYRIYSSIANRVTPQDSAPAQLSPQGMPQRVTSSGPSGPLSPVAYVQQFQPRVPGLAYTAPIYDKVTAPTRAPYPAACVQSKTKCQCYTQQGTKLETDKALCEGIVAGGFFMAWDEGRGQHQPQALPPARPVGPAEPLPGYINLTPGHQSTGTQVAASDQVQQDAQGIRAAKRKN